jgi:hypothetical protein
VDASTTWPEPSIDDYAERTATTIEAWKSVNGQQPGDPVKLARALLTIADLDEPPLRFVAGSCWPRLVKQLADSMPMYEGVQ